MSDQMAGAWVLWTNKARQGGGSESWLLVCSYWFCLWPLAAINFGGFTLCLMATAAAVGVRTFQIIVLVIY